MSKFRKKPLVIEAVRWLGSNPNEVNAFVESHDPSALASVAWSANGDLMIITLEGTLHASIGDYIIRGVQGEFYPCKPDIFAETYEEVLDG